MISEPLDLRDLPLLAPAPVATEARAPRLALRRALGEPTSIPFLFLADALCACLVTLLRPDRAPTALTGLGSFLAIALLAGGGVRGGQAIGKSDRIAAFPASKPYFPSDLGATIYAALGIDPCAHYQDAAGRPYPITVGKPMHGLYGS